MAPSTQLLATLVLMVAFFQPELVSSTSNGTCLLVLLSGNLEFTEPSGNELALWSPIKAYIA